MIAIIVLIMKCAAACSEGSLHSVNYCPSCRRGYHSRFELLLSL